MSGWANDRPILSAVRDGRLASAAHDLLSMAYWRTFARGRRDVLLCSYPKSGRTWLRFIVVHAMREDGDTETPLRLIDLPAESPNLTLLPGWRPLRPTGPRSGTLRLIGSHSEEPWLFRHLPVLFLYRHPGDVVVSHYWHLRARGELGDRGLAEFVRSARGLQRVIRYMRRWLEELERRPGASVVITYEQMKNDVEAVMGRCLRELGHEVAATRLRAAIKASELGRMQRLESISGSTDFSAERIRSDPSARQVRRGEVGGYRSSLDDETVEWVDEAVGRQLSAECLTALRVGEST